MSSPSVLGEEAINELIWGGLRSEIIDREFPLHTVHDVIHWTTDLVVQLFYGFLYFMHYKRGLTPKFTYPEEGEFRFGDLDDPSKWVECMMFVGRGYGKPYSFRHFADKNDGIHTVTVL